MATVGEIQAGEASVGLHLDSHLNVELDAATKDAQQKLQAMAQNSERVSKGWLANLKSNARATQMEERKTGEMALERMMKNPLEGVAKMGGAGLAVMAVDLVGHALNHATEEAVKLRNEFDEGKISAGELPLKIAEGIPIAGEFISAITNVYELVTREKEMREENNKIMKEAVELEKKQEEAAERLKGAMERGEHDQRRVDAEAAKENATPIERQKIENQAKLDDEHERISKDKKAALEAFDKETEAEKAQIRNRMDAAKAKGDTVGAGIAQRKLDGFDGERAGVRQDVASRFDAQDKAVDEKLKPAQDKHLAEMQSEADAQYAEAIESGNKLIVESEARAAAERLKMKGDTDGAEILLIRAGAAKKKAEIMAGVEKEAKRLNLDPESAEGARKFRGLKDNAAKETAAIDASAGTDVAAVKQRRDDKEGRANREADFQIAQDTVRMNERGLAQRLALIELERKHRLDMEADPKTATGVSTDRINQQADLQKKLAENQTQTAGGSFSASAAAAMGMTVGGGKAGESPADREAKKIAKSTDDAAKLLKGIHMTLEQAGHLCFG